jgi:hypothetical protein
MVAKVRPVQVTSVLHPYRGLRHRLRNWCFSGSTAPVMNNDSLRNTAYVHLDGTSSIPSSAVSVSH